MNNTSAPAVRYRVRRSWAAMITGITAVSAVAGGVGLATGTVDMGATITARLPWHSTVLAGMALLVVVAVPMAWACFLAAWNRPGQDVAVITAGALLVGWIAVEVAVIREFSWLQAVFAVIGLVVLLTGLLMRRPAEHRPVSRPRARRSGR
ncbi:MAG TPA: hypothetical protein VFW65_17065 [Pseudonocardiaceae bacterium]|nr:hypothetical protein [Pseudonocardiaceae bacterium]